MSVLFADNLAERRGYADVNAVLSQLKVKHAGCFYQAPHQVGSNEGFMVLVLNDLSDALKAHVKFAGGRIVEIALQDINTPIYKSEILSQDWNTQSTCRTEIVPALVAPRVVPVPAPNVEPVAPVPVPAPMAETPPAAE